MLLENIGTRVQRYRKAKKISQAKFAEMLGMSTNYISSIETGTKIPKLETFINIANALEVSADYLLMDVLDKGQNLVSNEIAEQVKDLSNSDLQIVNNVIKVLVAELRKKTNL